MDWARLATAVDTLVILMGLENLPRIARALLRAGPRRRHAGRARRAGRDDRAAGGDRTAGRASRRWRPAPECRLRRSSSWATSWRCGRVFSGASADGSDEVGVGAGEQGVGAEAELGEELMQVLLAAR